MNGARNSRAFRSWFNKRPPLFIYDSMLILHESTEVMNPFFAKDFFIRQFIGLEYLLVTGGSIRIFGSFSQRIFMLFHILQFRIKPRRLAFASNSNKRNNEHASIVWYQLWIWRMLNSVLCNYCKLSNSSFYYQVLCWHLLNQPADMQKFSGFLLFSWI